MLRNITGNRLVPTTQIKSLNIRSRVDSFFDFKNIGFTTHQLMSVLDGDLDELTDALLKAESEAQGKTA